MENTGRDWVVPQSLMGPGDAQRLEVSRGRKRGGVYPMTTVVLRVSRVLAAKKLCIEALQHFQRSNHFLGHAGWVD